MSTRKIKNARDLESNELIYFKSHAQATFMSDGSTVEDVINEIKETGGADLTDYVTITQLNTSLSGKQDTISDLADIRSGASKGATAVQPTSLSTVATSGSYNDLSNKPTIPTAVTINGSTKTGSTIALGTVVTGVTMNGSAKTVSNGKVDLGTIITAHQTLKTINGESIVGSGDITISGGGDDSSIEWAYAPGFDEAGYWCVTFYGNYTMSPNKIYVVPDYPVGSIDLTNLEHVNEYGDEYRIIFKTHDIYPLDQLYFGNGNYNIVYENGIEPEFKADTWYDIRLIRTVHKGAQQICVIATEFSNQPSSGSSGGSSDANVQAVDTGDVLDEVTIDYATKTYVDGLVGDINSVLDNIIDGSGSNNSQKYILWTEDDLQFGGENNIAQPNVKYICTTPITQIVFGDISGEEWHGGITEPYSEYTFIFECNNTSIETSTSILWANGSQPILENGVRYELSISLMHINNEYIGHAVLVPFKTV